MLFRSAGALQISYGQDAMVRTLRQIQFVTSATPEYAEYAKRLKESCGRFGLDLMLVEQESTGSWHRNRNLKSKAIRRALDAEPHRPVVWIDADGEVMRSPDLFCEFDLRVDIAMFRGQPWGGGAIERCMGTTFFANNLRVRAVIADWERNMESDPLERAQVNLCKAMDSCPSLTYQPLPFEYCAIDKSPLLEGCDPVIYHHQASRVMRKKVGNVV